VLILLYLVCAAKPHQENRLPFYSVLADGFSLPLGRPYTISCICVLCHFSMMLKNIAFIPVKAIQKRISRYHTMIS
ncbi:hypothetical protein, partial [Dialister invisus]|uniref:hypothetical protein n=1 Tax=Dialister invisus TaxID=218538 RepID=UPI002352835D